MNLIDICKAILRYNIPEYSLLSTERQILEAGALAVVIDSVVEMQRVKIMETIEQAKGDKN